VYILRIEKESDRYICVCIHSFFSLRSGASNVICNIQRILKRRACAHDCQNYHLFFKSLWTPGWHNIQNIYWQIGGVYTSLIRRLLDYLNIVTIYLFLFNCFSFFSWIIIFSSSSSSTPSFPLLSIEHYYL
jgi:hypothetical protein